MSSYAQKTEAVEAVAGTGMLAGLILFVSGFFIGSAWVVLAGLVTAMVFGLMVDTPPRKPDPQEGWENVTDADIAAAIEALDEACIRPKAPRRFGV
jgi:hypothetical protein